MKKKVLHLFRNLKYGGNQALGYDLVRYSSPDYSHSILALQNDLEMKKEFESLGCSIDVIEHKETSFQEFKYKFEEYVKNNDFLIVVTWFYPYALRLNISGVNFIHHIGTAPLKTPVKQWLKNLFIVKMYGNKTDNFVFASKYIEAKHKNTFNSVFDNSSVIYNGIDTERFLPKTTYDHELSFTIIMVGRLDGSKDFDTLIRITKELSKSILNLKVNIVGDGSDRARLEQLSIDCKVNNIVSFLGRRSDVPQLLHNSDLCVFLNKPLEGFGLVIVEAMSTGLPVVSYNLGANSEIIKNSINGFLVGSKIELIDKIKLISQSEELAKKIGTEARLAASLHFDVKRMVKTYEELY